MNARKASTRVLSLVLALCMIVGLLPMNVFAAEVSADFEASEATSATVLDAAIFCSDVHGSTSDLTATLGGVKTSGITYSAIGFVGDTCLSTSTVSTTVSAALGYDSISCVYSYAASHDTENSSDLADTWDKSGRAFENDNYIIYTIREEDVQYAEEGYAATAAAAFTEWFNGLSDAQKTKPLFIISHRPLHARRSDNAGAEIWVQAINPVAAQMDVVFFWAHNHTSEQKTDTSAYYVAKGSTLNVETANAKTSNDNRGTTSSSTGEDYTINFTYMNAGYINANGQNPARIGVATTVQITANSLIFQDYNSSGKYTDSYAHNVTIDRDHAPAVKVPQQLKVTGVNEYVEGDEFAAPAVTVVYSDGTTYDALACEPVITDAEGNEVAAADVTETVGSYTLTYSYTEDGYAAKAEFPVAVVELVVESIEVNGAAEYTVGADFVEPVVTATYNNGTNANVAYDCAIADAEGNAVTAANITEAAGTYTLTISYTFKDTTLTETFEVTVVEAEEPEETTTAPEETTTAPEEGSEETNPTETPTEPEIPTVSCNATYVDEDGAIQTNTEVFYATGAGLTGITAAWNDTVFEAENVVKMFAEDDYVVYDIALEGYTEGNVTMAADIYYMEAEGLVVYYVNEDGTLTEVTVDSAVANTDAEDEEICWTTVTFTTDKVGTYVIGHLAEVVEEDATLTDLVISGDYKTKYFLNTDLTVNGNVYLDLTGLIVTAVFSDESEVELEWNEFDETQDGYSMTFGDLTTVGEKTVTVSYTYGETTLTETFQVYVGESSFAAEDVDASVTVTVPCVTAIEIKQVETVAEEIAAKAAEVLGDGFVTYDITAEYITGYDALEGTAKVTLLIPEGVTNPAVYYISDDGTKAERMTVLSTADGKVTFVTSHFSTYVVGEATGEGPVSVTVTGTEETVIYYEQVTSLSNNGVYLFVSGTSGTAYALGNDVADEHQVTFDDEGNITDAGGALEWTAARSSNRYTFTSGTYMLGVSNGSLSLTTSSNWSYSSNRLSYSTGNGNNQTTYYLRYTNGSWSATSSTNSSSSRTVYIFQKVTETTTLDGVYTITGTSAEFTVVDGTTGTLASTLTRVNGDDETITQNPDGAVYSLVENGDPNTIIESLNGSTGAVEFTGAVGQALVKVEYTVNGQTAYDYIIVTAKAPSYSVALLNKDGADAGESIVVKGATNGITYDLGCKITYDLSDDTWGEDITEGTVTYNIVSGGESATIDSATGVLTFTGVDGKITVEVHYVDKNGNDCYDFVTVTAQVDLYTRPGQSTKDFPVWGEDGSVSYNKTATAVGDFSQTGTTMVELSVAAIPHGGGSDVVIMLDRSTSMDSDRIDATVDAVQAFLSAVYLDGTTFNNADVRLYIGYYMGDAEYSLTTAEEDGFQVLSDIDEYNTLYAKIATGFTVQTGTRNTDWQVGLAKAQTLLTAAKAVTGYNRAQYLVFMSDGAPTDYIDLDGDSHDLTGNQGASSSDWVTTAGARDTDYEYEYYSTAMKAADVTIYSVLLGETATQAQYLMNDVSGPKGEKQADFDTGSTMSKAYTGTTFTDFTDDDYFFSVTDTNASLMSNVFKNIAGKVAAGITNAEIADEIGENYEIVFDFNTAAQTAAGSDAYMELVSYGMTKNSDGTVTRNGESHTLQRIYFGADASGNMIVSKILTTTTDGTCSWYVDGYTVGAEYNEVSGYEGTVAGGITPTFTNAVTAGSKAYYNYDSSTGAYSYAPNGDGNAWMSTGAYVKTYDDGNTWLHTVYFSYNLTTETFYWTIYTTGTEGIQELCLRYFAYLTNSLEYLGTDNEIPPEKYYTNEYATLSYTNFRGELCQVTFPKPYMMWNGASVSYVFYLVNEAGEPVNRAGRKVDFEDAIFVTDIFTEAIVWNGDGAATALDVNYKAEELLPADYVLYDDQASYDIFVYKQAGTDNTVSYVNYFIIGGGDQTYLNSRHTSVTAASLTTTKVFNNKSTTVSGYGTYSDTKVGEEVTVNYTDSNLQQQTVTYTPDFQNTWIDYSSTTVAFAVTWKQELTEDVVVVDFGLPVEIDVVSNDFVYNYITGIGTNIPVDETDSTKSVVMNTGTYQNSQLNGTDTDGDGYPEIQIATAEENVFHTAEVTDDNHVLFTPGSGESMIFSEPAVFYYETEVTYYENSELDKVKMYSKVTVIPATTVYYEDDFVDLTVQSKATGTWTTVDGLSWTVHSDGTYSGDGLQDEDRPGENLLTSDGSWDADNNYGFDSEYEKCSLYSLGSAAYIDVNSITRGVAQFDFYGTGFDVISLTSNVTGTITVTVYNATSGAQVKSFIVDTYYGYVYNADDNSWTISDDYNDPNALYQIPVMKVSGLTYGKYKVKILAAYNSLFDHDQDVEGNENTYRFYLDAIRIYDPTGVVSGEETDSDVSDAYEEDNEGWPVYKELRDLVISAASTATLIDTTINSTLTVEGAVFIDGYKKCAEIATYTSYGPNNELYLAPGQGIAFQLNELPDLADVQLAVKSVGGTGSVSIFNPGTVVDGTTTSYVMNNNLTIDVDTATDMYYSIKEQTDDVIVIYNSGATTDAVISITNLKFTFTASTTADISIDVTNVAATYAMRAMSFYSESSVNNEVLESEGMAGSTAPKLEGSVPKVEETEPEVKETEPKVEETEPEVKETELEVKETEPEVKETEPKVEETEPEVKETEPEVEETEPEVKETEPEVKETEPEVKEAEPEVKEAEPEVKETEPKVEATEPVVEEIETAEPTSGSWMDNVMNAINKFIAGLFAWLLN